MKINKLVISVFVIFALINFSGLTTKLFAQKSRSEKENQKSQLANCIPNLRVNDIFKDVVKNDQPPKVLDTLETTILDDDIEVSKIHFESKVDKERVNKLYAIFIHKKGESNLPAILILHGGTQTADEYYKLGVLYAKQGYAVLIPDLPGITSPEWANRKGKGSTGGFARFPYGEKHFETKPDITQSVIYEGVVAAIQAFYLLKNHSVVNPNLIGVRGLSWGGYATTITRALLGKQVKAGFAVFGSGFYDLPSYFKSILDKMETSSRDSWLSALDAGRYADRIKAPFYFMAASNDTYFYPPAVMATYDRIKGDKNVLFAPNNDHDLTNVADPQATEFTFFNHYLHNKELFIPLVVVKSNKLQLDSSSVVEFKVNHSRTINNATVWYTVTDSVWTKKKWLPIVATSTKNYHVYSAILPREVATLKGHWYIIATDNLKVSNGTKIH